MSVYILYIIQFLLLRRHTRCPCKESVNAIYILKILYYESYINTEIHSVKKIRIFNVMSGGNPENIRYPLYSMLVGPRGDSRRAQKISPPMGYDPRTVQSVASRCTVYTIPAAAFV